jgi:hypothetical protein
MSTENPSENSNKHEGRHIVVNGEEKTTNHESLTFHEVCLLAFPDGPFGDAIRYTVTYTYKHGGGDVSMVEGDSVEIKNGMIFNVGNTDRS